MMDTMPESTFQGWWDFYTQNPWDNTNTQLAMILSSLTGQPAHRFGAVKRPTTPEEADAIFRTMGLM